ncbi:Brp/Blh family beta-carotene 15,15'-dioxygenase [Flavobacterium difficile]|uniref:Probable beta-carotene 15,15'-dioxygenase n=1 Tax=Flavobacterium difficile TaxID=2709659 RepID=A0ABX0I6Z4_9FLAO|nr:Brp/Blh family beta-carotene 15,15'-dioxygenase [Flavobacterium difficile]NHM01512.1 beta-carotene 15,15'-dioxygenase, Brp/Blh family [Flavobacterium difficile]
MSKYDSLAIVISFYSLWISSYLSDIYEVILGIILILTFGIYHGANDILISSKFLSNGKAKNSITILVFYVFQVLLALLLFYLSPLLGLLLFILASSYHFGEQQLSFLKTILPETYLRIYALSYGLMLFFLLFMMHPAEVVAIVKQITFFTIDAQHIYYGFVIFMCVFLLFTFLVLIAYPKSRGSLFYQFLFLGVYAIIFKVSSLIWGFAIYFIVWHSIPSMQLQTIFIYGSLSRFHFFKYVKDAFLYWILSVLAIGLFYYFQSTSKFFITVIFSFFSAITYPHAFVIFKMLQQKKTE